ncbi:MAG: hypothetical protein ABI277_02385 [Burkholderiaceae bacterium]
MTFKDGSTSKKMECIHGLADPAIQRSEKQMPDYSFDPRPHSGIVIFAAAVSTLTALGIVIGVVTLFQSRGIPLEEAVLAERACESKLYVSDKQECMREWMASAHLKQFARR